MIRVMIRDESHILAGFDIQRLHVPVRVIVRHDGYVPAALDAGVLLRREEPDRPLVNPKVGDSFDPEDRTLLFTRGASAMAVP